MRKIKKPLHIKTSGLYIFFILFFVFSACKSLKVASKTENTKMPEAYLHPSDTTNSALIQWNSFFSDPNLIVLIDSALANNQELNIMLQEINIAQTEVRARKGEYLPNLNAFAGAGADKAGRYTLEGATEEQVEIIEEKKNPVPIPDFNIGLSASWEIDIWKKLRNAKAAAYNRYLASINGKNFMVTTLVSEIASTYYELVSLDNQLNILNQNLQIQTNALRIVKQQKDAARVTELAVKKFEAEVFHTESLIYELKQQIVEKENKINFLVGRFPQPVARDSENFINLVPPIVFSGIPSQLLANRTDLKQAEYNLIASKLDVKVAKAKFYPSFGIRAGIGFNAFNFKYFLRTPQSILFNLAGDLIAPLLNRNAIKAEFYSANSKQIQAAYKYEQTILNAYVEVYNQVSNISNLNESFALRKKQVDALSESVNIANKLFQSAEADYMEVLMTQRDALESRLDLIETKTEQLRATIQLYKALGGGWK